MHSLLRSDPIIFQELQQLLQDTFVEASVVSGVPFHRPQQQSWKPIKVVNIFKLMLHIFEYSNFFSFSSTVNFSCARSCHYIRSSKVGTTFCTLGNWSKLLYSKRTHLWGRRRSGGGGGGILKDTTYLRTLPTTFYWLLNLSSHKNIQLARVGITRQTKK